MKMVIKPNFQRIPYLTRRFRYNYYEQHPMASLLKRINRAIFLGFQSTGINFLPNHYYSNIPDIRTLMATFFWRKPSSMIGVNGADTREQLQFINNCHAKIPRKELLRDSNIIQTARALQKENGFSEIDGDLLYCFIGAHQPKKIIQIGAGVSTAIILRAAQDLGYQPEITCIEPYPSKYLQTLDEEGWINLIPNIEQKVPIEIQIDLNKGDLLFIDSTHTIKAGGDVNRIILEVLPRLKKGVFVHFHDILFPYDYQRNVLDTLYFWQETSLLHAFLIHNTKYSIKASMSMLHYEQKEALQQLFPNYVPQEDEDGLQKGDIKNKHFPTSAYLQVIA